MPMRRLARYLPVLEWGRSYGRGELGGDLVAAVIVTIMLIPQSLAYALLAGLPPEAGIYASILPIIHVRGDACDGGAAYTTRCRR
jgi:SulP family sulfate permease